MLLWINSTFAANNLLGFAWAGRYFCIILFLTERCQDALTSLIVHEFKVFEKDEKIQEQGFKAVSNLDVLQPRFCQIHR